MKYANYDDKNGNILGFYESSIHREIPKPFIELSNDEWIDCIEHQGLRIVDVDAKKIIKLAPPLPSLDDLKDIARDDVRDFAKDARAKLADYADQYKLAGWNDKAQRAQRVIDKVASESDIAILKAECDKRGKQETPEQLAATQAAKSQKLAMAVAIIDGMEAAALEAIDSKRNENTLAELSKELKAQANVQLNQLLEAT